MWSSSCLVLNHGILMIYRILSSIRVQVLALIRIKGLSYFFDLNFFNLIKPFLEFRTFYIVQYSLWVCWIERFIFLTSWGVSDFIFYLAKWSLWKKQIIFWVVLTNRWGFSILLMIQILERIVSRGNWKHKITLNWCIFPFLIRFFICRLNWNGSLLNHLCESHSHFSCLTWSYLAIWIKAREYFLSQSFRRELTLIFCSSLWICAHS